MRAPIARAAKPPRKWLVSRSIILGGKRLSLILSNLNRLTKLIENWRPTLKLRRIFAASGNYDCLNFSNGCVQSAGSVANKRGVTLGSRPNR